MAETSLRILCGLLLGAMIGELVSCGLTPGQHDDGGTINIRIRQPQNPQEAATVIVTDGNNRVPTITASTGQSRGIDQALKQLSPLIWVGMGLCVIGVGLLVCRAYVPMIPAKASIALIVLGGAFIVGPLFLDRYSWIVIALGVTALAGVLIYYGYKHNWYRSLVSNITGTPTPTVTTKVIVPPSSPPT